MNIYRITYKNGTTKEVQANKTIDVIRKYDLATKEHIGTTVTRLEHTQRLAESIA